MADSQGISIIFVPGAWHTTASYDLVIDELKSDSKPYNIVRVELASVGAEPGSAPTWSFLPDIQAIESAVSAEVESGKKVLVVSHSYGSIPTQEALHRYVDSGKVKQLIIAGFLLEQGESLMALGGGTPAPWWDRKGDFLEVKGPADIFYNDLPESMQKEKAVLLKPHAYVTKISPQAHPSYLSPSLSTTYLSCLRDQACLLVWQEGMLARARDKNGARHIDVRKIDTGHSPFFNRPTEVADLIRELAGSFTG